jgi:hypothetical protein
MINKSFYHIQGSKEEKQKTVEILKDYDIIIYTNDMFLHVLKDTYVIHCYSTT